MDPLRTYVIPLKSLRNGIHHFNWELNHRFFEHFENSSLQKGTFQVEVVLDKQDDLSTLQMNIEGSYEAKCDRCLAVIRIPVSGDYTLYAKTAEEEESDPSLLCIGPGELELKLASVIYDYVCISLPISQTIECDKLEDPPCDREVLKRIQLNDEPSDTSAWDVLKNFEQT